MTNGAKRFPWFETVLLLGYIAVGSLAINHHVLWRDETIPWRLATQSASLPALLHNARGQNPHLLPWPLIVWVASRFTHNLAGEQVAHLLLATAAVVVFLYASPLRPIDKALFCLGYFPLFEYCVICRGYVLVWLMMFAFCTLYCRDRGNLLALGAVLFLLAITDLLGAVMAAAIIVGMAVEFWGQETAPHRVPAFCIACAGVLVAAAQVIYNRFGLPHAGWPVPPLHTQIWGTLRCPWSVFALVPEGFPHWPQFSWGYNSIDRFRVNWFVSVLSVAMIAGLSPTVRGMARWTWLAGCAFMVGLSLLTGDLAVRHWGLLFLLYVACRWIDHSRNRPAWHAKLLTTLFAVQAVAGVYAWSAERTQPFSGARAAAAIIQSNHWENLLLLGQPADDLTSVQSYLDRDIYYLDFGGWSHVQFYDCNCPPVEIGRAMATTCRMVEESGTNAVLILNDLLAPGFAALVFDKPGDILPVALPDGRIARFRVSVAGLTAGIVGGENYMLYLIEGERSPVSPSIARIILNPDDAKAHYNLGVMLEQLGRKQEAMEHWEQALRLKPDYAEAHYNLGVVSAQTGKIEAAIAHYEQGLRIRPDDAKAHYNLATVLLRAGRVQDGINHYEQGLRIRPDDAEAHNNLGMALRQAGRLEEAIGHYEQALRLKPDFAVAHYNLGNVLVQAGRVQDGIGHYEQALRIQPDYAEAHLNLGATLLELGRAQEAIEHFEQAVRIKPDTAEAHVNLGVALEQVGRVREAIGHYEQALRLKPDFTQAQKGLARLQAGQ